MTEYIKSLQILKIINISLTAKRVLRKKNFTYHKYAPARIVQSLKAWTSRDLREKFSIIRQIRYSDDLWASSYYCGTAGHVSAEAVAKYIRENFKRYY